MSFPNIPNITPTISISTAQTIPLLLASIAFEELALAHIVNAEAEKLQLVLGTLTPTRTIFSPAVVSLSNLLTIDASVQSTLRDVIKKEMLLEFKFENVLELMTPPSPPVTGCTLTRGFFATHQAETLQLLAMAGGTIILGNDSLGFSTIVTAANIFDVLNGNVGPSPQYRQLNAQLLTAKLNVLNGANCQFAQNTIALADAFLTNPIQNDVVASQIQQMLAEFNEGNAPGCPGHCPGTEF
ncbi:hypothetical protein WAX78_01795 [Bacillus sp. FJAT-53711]|uniref:Uncharacterized protein n=1 Tax=Bacillus yunxiaonensis TaxID=3127665 RepID=A0ABU8FQF3_9BACI